MEYSLSKINSLVVRGKGWVFSRKCPDEVRKGFPKHADIDQLMFVLFRMVYILLKPSSGGVLCVADIDSLAQYHWPMCEMHRALE